MNREASTPRDREVSTTAISILLPVTVSAFIANFYLNSTNDWFKMILYFIASSVIIGAIYYREEAIDRDFEDIEKWENPPTKSQHGYVRSLIIRMIQFAFLGTWMMIISSTSVVATIISLVLFVLLIMIAVILTNDESSRWTRYANSKQKKADI